jgi:hypothetical protein
MRLATTLLPFTLLAASASANLATDAFGWASSLVSSSNGQAQASKDGEVRTMDSWSYVDCGELLASESVRLLWVWKAKDVER